MSANSERIFKPYDIRGIYPEELNEDAAYRLGRSFGIFIKDFLKKQNPVVVIGRDSRLSSGALEGALRMGLLEEGIRTLHIGISTSPMHLFGIVHLGGDAGIMITASHNPKEYNGFKISLKNGESIGEDSGLKEIRAIFDRLNGAAPAIPDNGGIVEENVVDAYVQFLVKGHALTRKFKIAADAGNGTAGVVLPTLCKSLGVDCVPLFFEPDGNFPHRSPDPTKEGAATQVCAAVRARSADLGVLFDADADRVIFVDEQGAEINPNHISAMLAEYFLEKHPREHIWYDAVASKIVPETIAAHGGIPVIGRVGRVRAKAAMKKYNCIFGGEHSAHYYFRDYFFSDSALLAMVCVLEALSREEKKLSEVLKKYEKYVQSGELNFKVSEKEALLRSLEEQYRDGAASRLDGLTVEYADWWFNVRASNTEPLVRLNIEARTAVMLARQKEKLLKLLQKYEG